MKEKTLKGSGVSDGIRIGKVFVYRHVCSADTERDIVQDETAYESERFRKAVQQAITELDGLIAHAAETLGRDKVGVLKGQKGMLLDPAYSPQIEKLIVNQLYSPEKAVHQVTEQYAAIFQNMKNDYMKERAADVRDAGSRLVGILCGKRNPSLAEIREPVILAAEDLSPSDTIQLDKHFILAFATERGGKTSHTSIFAKSLGIPAVVGIGGLTDELQDGDEMVVDGTQGICILSPSEETISEYTAKMNKQIAEQDLYSQDMKKPARTQDGQRIIVAANIGSAGDSTDSLSHGAEAVGLFRTESLFLSKGNLPSEEEQFEEYKKIAEICSPREVIVRTLDIGGDKALKSLGIPQEDNPFLGYRAIRLCLDRKELFLTQLRAILRAGVFGNLKIMFPMISGLEELWEAKKILEQAKMELKARNTAFDENIKTGIMIEIPSAAVMADEFAKEVDFFSIGTNDLIQYTVAVDRGNEKVSYLYDSFQPAVLRFIKNVSDAAHGNGIPVGICGNMGAEPSAIPLHIGFGIDEISMPAGVIPKIKYEISRQKTADCMNIAQKALECRTTKEVHSLIEEYQMHLAKSLL